MELIKDNDSGQTFQTDKDNFKILYRNNGAVAGDNDINVEEEIYLITGKAKITLENKTWEVDAPVKLHFPAKTYHKIEALTDISFVIFEL